MALEQRLSLKMSQRLVMTPSLQQAIRLLQLSKLELAEEIAQELVENPVLEEQDDVEAEAEAALDAGLETERSAEDERPASEAREEADAETPGEKEHDSIDEMEIDLLFRDSFESGGSAPNMSEVRELPSLENAPAAAPDLHDHLLWQLSMQGGEPRLQLAAKAVVWNIDDDGYLQADDDELLEGLADLAEEDPEFAACAPYRLEDVRRARKRVTRFDPVGVGARSLEECLLIQLEHHHLQDSLAADVVRHHLDLLRQHKYGEIAKKLGVDEERAREAAEVVRTLNPKPGASFGGERGVHVVPDVVVEKVDGEYKIFLNDEGLPRLRISPIYRRLLERAKAARAGEALDDGPAPDKETRNYVRDKFRSALWFIKSLDQRQQTIYKVAESIVKHQAEFLDQGVQALRPLVLRDVAEDVEMHESTISRVVTNKYMHTPQGVLEMKFFFHSGLSTSGGSDISSLAVKEKIKALIDQEPHEKPLSDSAIVKMLKEQGIEIARRTVAKYRDELGIPSSPMRKRM
jgi:RNA polymerase sigma-54 factor